MRATRGKVHWRRGDPSHVVPLDQQVESGLLRVDFVHGEIPHFKILMQVFINVDLVPLLEWHLLVLVIEQVESLLVVNFKVGDKNSHLVAAYPFLLFYVVEDVREGPWNDPSGIPAVSSTHRESFSAPCLPVSEYSAVVPVDKVGNHRPCNDFENLFLS